jgi:hypothetical protein
MAFNPVSAFFSGFPVKPGIVGQRHIVHPAADFAVEMMMKIPPPVIPDQFGIAFNLHDFPFFLQNHKITVHGSQTNPFCFCNLVKNFPGRRMIPAANRLENQFPLAGITPV